MNIDLFKTSFQEELNSYDALEYVGFDSVLWFETQAKKNNQRIGQYWFNHLSAGDQRILSGSLADPFFSDRWIDVICALAYLLLWTKR